MKKLILICLLLPLIASCAGKAADYGLSEEEFNTKSNQFLLICEGQMYKCDKIFPKVITFRDFLSNYDRYNKYPVDILQIALSRTATNGNYAENNNSFWHEVEEISKARAERNRLLEKYEKYNRPRCDKSSMRDYSLSDSTQENCLVNLDSDIQVYEQEHDGTLVLSYGRLYFIEWNKTDSSLPNGAVLPRGVLECTGRIDKFSPDEFFPNRLSLDKLSSLLKLQSTILKFKRLQ